MPTQTADPLIGRTLEGRYRIQSLLARGGMSTVYVALDERLDRLVALKVMSAALSADPIFVDRFTREARAAARLSHVNVVSVFDQGNDSGHAFLVMELVRGRTLRDLLRESRPLPPALAISIMSPVLAALAAAHRAGLVHRDVKPENILLADDGVVKVADFGLARAIEADRSDTQTGIMMGTVAYCSPEQISQSRTDARSDVYAAGVVLYELLTGETPFRGGTAMAIAYQHVNSRVPAPSDPAGPGRGLPIHPALDTLVLRATSREPSARPVDAGAMLAELHDVRSDSGLPIVAVPRPPRLQPGRTQPIPPPQHGQPQQRPPHASPGGPRGPQPGTRPMPPGGPIGPGQVSGPPAAARPGAPSSGAARPGTSQPGMARPSAALPTAPSRLPAAQAPMGHAPTTQNPLPPAALRSGPPLAHGSVGSTSRPPAQRRGAGAPGGPAGPGGPNGPRPPSTPTTEQAARRRRRRRRRAIVAVALVLLLGALAAVGSWWWVSGRYTSVPNVLNAPIDKARTTLTDHGLKAPATPKTAFSETVPANMVISSTPAPGRRILPGKTVSLIVSAGAERFAVPDVTGKSQSDATAALQAIPVQVVPSQASDDTAPIGSTIRTDPPAGTEVKRGQVITLYISTGPPVIAVPDVTGQSQDDAESALTAAGFTPAATQDYSTSVDKGDVISQTPGANTSAVKFSTVNIVVSLGPQLVAIPAIPSGTSVDSATATLQALGLTVTIHKNFGGFLNQVVGLTPAAGTKVQVGSSVTLDTV